MKEIKQNKTFTIELTKDEVKYIQGLTQNSINELENNDEASQRLIIFVGMSRLLGMSMDDNGMLLPSIR